MNPNLPDLSTLAQWPTVIVLGLCAFAGLTLKGIPTFRNWLIPFVVGGFGGIVGWCLLSPDFNGLLLGILLGGISVYGHQLVTQFINRYPPEEAGRNARTSASAPILLACLLPLFLTGCATAPKDTATDGATSQKIVAALKSVDASANAFLTNPMTQVGAQPAGALLTYGALWSYTLSGGDNTQALAAEICGWCQGVYGLLTGTVTPEQVDDLGEQYGSHLNAIDPKFAPAFGPVQGQVRRIVTTVGGTPGAARDVLLKFIAGVQLAASKFT
ncbi:MAG: phage holin family protein [Verrucomicrobiia bacterium]